MGSEIFDVFEVRTPETPEIDYSDIEEMVEAPDIRYDIPDVEKAIVVGSPEEAGKLLDFNQGDEVKNAWGTCGLTSIANLCILNGQEVTEGMVVTYALENNLCAKSRWNPGKTGGTGTEQQLKLLEHYGIKGEFHRNTGEGTYDLVAKSLAEGKGVIAKVDADMLWNTAGFYKTYLGSKESNHVVTVTGAAIDAETGNVAGLYICDSGRGRESDACRYLSIEEFSKCSGRGIARTGFIITDDPIRKTGVN